VLVSGLSLPDGSDSDDETEGEEDWDDRSEWFQTWLQRQRLSVPIELHPRHKDTLLYDLVEPFERCELVLRILDERDRTEPKIEERMAKSGEDWIGKYCMNSRYEIYPRERFGRV
jgi:hypothetical protein